MSDTISISRGLLDEIISHCREGYPNEACGILAGKGNTVEKVYKMTNIKNSPVDYEMDSVEQLRCQKEIKEAGLRVICIYHSHPSSSPSPSQVDIIRASWPGEPDVPLYPDAFYMIVGPIKGDTEVKVFRLSVGRVKEVNLNILFGGESPKRGGGEIELCEGA